MTNNRLFYLDVHKRGSEFVHRFQLHYDDLETIFEALQFYRDCGNLDRDENDSAHTLLELLNAAMDNSLI